MAKYVAGIRERKKAETRNHLAQATVELIMTEGFESATIAAISERANVSSRTFHNYFPHRDAAIKHYLDQLVDDMVDKCEELPPGLHPVDAMRALTIDFRKTQDSPDKTFDRLDTLFIGARNSPHLDVETESFKAMQKLAGAIGKYTENCIDSMDAYLLIHASVGLSRGIELASRGQQDCPEEKVLNLLNRAFDGLKRGFTP